MPHKIIKKIKIKNRIIGNGAPCFVIAELGSNHDGKLEQAKELIDVAAWAKCDAVKMQIPIAAEAYPPGCKFGSIYGEQEIVAVIKKNEIPPEWCPELIKHAKKRGLYIGASTDGFMGLEIIRKNNFDFVKIPSFTISNIPLLKKAREGKTPFFMSTGAHSLGKVEEALDAVGSCPAALFHCISAYPAKLKNLNLRTVLLLQQAFDVPVGFSDHSLHPTLGPVFAVSLGACLLEKHFTLDRRLKGTDHFFALEPNELKEMVNQVRKVESDGRYKKRILNDPKNKILLGELRKGIFDAEVEFQKRTILGIYALKSLKKGQTVKATDVCILRCADTQPGLHPRYMDLIVGAKLVRSAEAFVPLYWAHFIERVKK